MKQQKQNRNNTGGKTKNETNNTSKNLKKLHHPKKPARGLWKRPTVKRRVTECYNIHQIKLWKLKENLLKINLIQAEM